MCQFRLHTKQSGHRIVPCSISPASRQPWYYHSSCAGRLLAVTLIIQRAEHRDTQAIHAKLDELLRVEGRARNERLDDEEPEVIVESRLQVRRARADAP
jgi:low affinity Fe/Cu permease